MTFSVDASNACQRPLASSFEYLTGAWGPSKNPDPLRARVSDVFQRIILSAVLIIAMLVTVPMYGVGSLRERCKQISFFESPPLDATGINPPSELEQWTAAVKIQFRYRGHLQRNKYKVELERWKELDKRLDQHFFFEFDNGLGYVKRSDEDFYRVRGVGEELVYSYVDANRKKIEQFGKPVFLDESREVRKDIGYKEMTKIPIATNELSRFSSWPDRVAKGDALRFFFNKLGPSAFSSEIAAVDSTNSTVANLMDRFTRAWNNETKRFDLPQNSFNLESFTQLLSNHATQFKKEDVNNEEHFGYIEKFDLDPSENSRIYVRADLHGDLKSLIENLRILQKEGHLDENFICKTGVHLVFLGDYCDRGDYGTEILEMLMCLRKENPQQVHLIRGNHEDSLINFTYGKADHHLMKIVLNEEATKALERFYETMPLTTYFSVDGGGSREYVQCTHGLFELTMDPAPLLAQACSGDDYLPVPKERKLSERIRRITIDSDHELFQSAKRIEKMVKQSKNLEENLTAYNWGDVTKDNESTLNMFSARWGRDYKLNARDIRHYLDLSSEDHQVMMLFRGHEHEFQHLMHKGNVLATTLPVGMDCSYYQNYFDQPDRAYIIEPDVHVKDWWKRAILREKGHIVAHESDGFPLTSSEV